MLNNIRIILVETSHTGNMGSTARAMKTMGLTQLYLVNPLIKPDSQSIALAAGASEIIADANVVDSLDEAICDCQLIIGTSARSRTLSWPMLDIKTCGTQIMSEAKYGQVAVVFGRERIGLTNHELQKCHYHIAIPANPKYSSLNLAMAVQIVCYEIRMAWLAVENDASHLDWHHQASNSYPKAQELEQFYVQLEQLLLATGFLKSSHPGQVMNKLRRLFNRARPEEQELNILRGILSSLKKDH